MFDLFLGLLIAGYIGLIYLFIFLKKKLKLKLKNFILNELILCNFKNFGTIFYALNQKFLVSSPKSNGVKSKAF